MLSQLLRSRFRDIEEIWILVLILCALKIAVSKSSVVILLLLNITLLRTKEIILSISCINIVAGCVVLCCNIAISCSKDVIIDMLSIGILSCKCSSSSSGISSMLLLVCWRILSLVIVLIEEIVLHFCISNLCLLNYQQY